MQNHDPRLDLTIDSDAWNWLLRLAYPGMDVKDGYELYGALRGLRSLGASLVISERGGYQIAAGEMDPTEYRLERVKWLMPHKERVADLLRQLKHVLPPREAVVA